MKQKKLFFISIGIISVTSLMIGGLTAHAYNLFSNHWKASTNFNYSVGSDISAAGVTSITIADNQYNNPGWYNNAFTRKVYFQNLNSSNSIKAYTQNYKNEIFKTNYGTGESLMVTQRWNSGGNTVEADVLINTSYYWSNESVCPPGNYDLSTVMLHEFGHVLGLDHSENTKAIMRPTFKATEMQRTLDKDDINGYNAINW
ncbi:matrixin family metalloprotease [Gorillibacterium sp. CAU 1737]|uniref:matrixin family metalloprotease n=1 Tax=Gorillibacterium sp. CAU 1737 TaxID=3140362 RepID=UPI003261B80B